jgi:outer membrane protein assembly factor BamB
MPVDHDVVADVHVVAERELRKLKALEIGAAPCEHVPGQDAAELDRDVHVPAAQGRAVERLPELESGANVRWRKAVPGLAHSSPVIFGDRLYLTTAVREGGESELKVGLYGDVASVADEGVHEFAVLCFDKRTGEELWRRQSWKGTPHFPRHPKGSFAASTPATDGKRVLAFFGSEGLFCYDAQGELLWKRDFGPLSAAFFMMPDAQWGFSSSPVIPGDMVILQVDVLGDCFVAALDLRTGEELWATPREDVPTWSTPTVDVREGRAQVICNGFKHAGGYELESGEPLWWLSGGGDIPVPTPIVAHDLICLTSAHGMLSGG